MKANTVGIFLAFVIISMAFTSMVHKNWEKIDTENNAFAKDCNNRGGEAKFDFNARQCIGAKIPSK